MVRKEQNAHNGKQLIFLILFLLSSTTYVNGQEKAEDELFKMASKISHPKMELATGDYLIYFFVLDFLDQQNVEVKFSSNVDRSIKEQYNRTTLPRLKNAIREQNLEIKYPLRMIFPVIGKWKLEKDLPDNYFEAFQVLEEINDFLHVDSVQISKPIVTKFYGGIEN